MSQVRLANHVMRQMAERVERWREELETLRTAADVGHAEFVELNKAYVELHVVRDGLRACASHIEQSLVCRQTLRDARNPPRNPDPSRFPLAPDKD